jgi:hypothetical protein
MPPRSAAGQAAPEYVALLALVAVVLGVAAASVGLVPGFGARVAAALRHGVCVVAGGVCSSSEARGEGLGPCRLLVHSNAEHAAATVVLVRVGRDDALAVERRSDGSVSVSFLDGWRLGAQTGAPGVSFARERLGEGVQAGAGLTFTTGREYRFPTLAAAAAFVHRYARQETLKGETAGRLGHRERLPEPDVRFMEAGAYAGAELDASVPGGAEGHAEGSLGAALGRRVDHARETLYLRLSASAAARLGAVVGSLSAAQSSEAVLEVTRERGRLVEARVTGAATLQGQLSLGGSTTSVAELADRLEQAQARHDLGGASLAAEGSVRLDLTDAANRAAVLGVATMLRPGVPPADWDDRLRALAGRLDAEGSVDLALYRQKLSETGGEAGVRLGIGLVGSYQRIDDVRELAGAWSLRHGGTLREREDCEEAARARA